MTTIIAHRGGKGRYAFLPASPARHDINSVALCADYMHLPVRLTRDGHPIIWHDAGIAFGASHQSLARINWQTLPDVVMHLEHALQLAAGTGCSLILEPKDRATAECVLRYESPHLPQTVKAVLSRRLPILRLLAAYQEEAAEAEQEEEGNEREQQILSVGALVDMQAIRDANPDFDPDILGDKIPFRHALDVIPMKGRLSVLFVNRELFTDVDLVHMARDRSRFVAALTVDDVDEARALVAMGVDGIVTNYPQRMKQALKKV